MTFAQFCDIAEGTEREQLMIEYLRKDEMESLNQIPAKVLKAPVIGKVLKAVIALAESGSIAEFRQTEHFQYIKDWNFSFDAESGNFSLSPGEPQKQKLMKIFAAISAGFSIFLLCRKFCKRRKAKK